MARLPIEESIDRNEQWEDWNNRYQEWIEALLDRENLKRDRVTPLFRAYGLASSLLGLINQESDTLAKQAKSDAADMDEKEIDALEVGVRKGVRARILVNLQMRPVPW